jgi:hypothetical protein
MDALSTFFRSSEKGRIRMNEAAKGAYTFVTV